MALLMALGLHLQCLYLFGSVTLLICIYLKLSPSLLLVKIVLKGLLQVFLLSKFILFDSLFNFILMAKHSTPLIKHLFLAFDRKMSSFLVDLRQSLISRFDYIYIASLIANTGSWLLHFSCIVLIHAWRCPIWHRFILDRVVDALSLTIKRLDTLLWTALRLAMGHIDARFQAWARLNHAHWHADRCRSSNLVVIARYLCFMDRLK